MSGPAAMPFEEAKNWKLSFGKYSKLPVGCRALDKIAESDEGLMYLDWLRGSLHQKCLDWQKRTREALDVYLSDAAIANDLAALLRKKQIYGQVGPVKNSIAGSAADRERQSLWGE